MLDNYNFYFKIPQGILCFPGGTSDKEPTCQCRRCKRYRFNPWFRKMPGEFHGQRSPVGYSPWDCEQSGMTELTNTQGILLYIKGKNTETIYN